MKNLVLERKQAKKKGYQPDLNELLSQCELNYLLFYRCWPDFNEQLLEINARLEKEQLSETKWSAKSNSVLLRMHITEQARYTTTAELIVTTAGLKKNRDINILIRLYHDVKMLEVMEGSGPSSLKAIYRSQTDYLRATDEKRQANRFVGECLKAVSF